MMLESEFTSTGNKLLAHGEALAGLRSGRPRPIVAHVMPTDVCQHRCAFCSVAARAGDSLSYAQIIRFVGDLVQRGLKAVIISGGGNPLLWRDKSENTQLGELVMSLKHGFGLEVGLITNGTNMRSYAGRRSYTSLPPAALDCLTWLRISLAGLDHADASVYVPDVDPTKTTLGFSYVWHDIYREPLAPHGCVSRPADLITQDHVNARVWRASDRFQTLVAQMRELIRDHKPRYLRLLPNCLEPALIPQRVAQLERVADAVDPAICFVQHKPPQAPPACFLGYVHPVLNCDGWVYPCDSCVLNEEAGHKFASSWRICRFDETDKMYSASASLIRDPAKQCPGCVFTRQNEILTGVVAGEIQPSLDPAAFEHVNFV